MGDLWFGNFACSRDKSNCFRDSVNLKGLSYGRFWDIGLDSDCRLLRPYAGYCLVGGTTKNADKKEIYIVKANGTVISKAQGGLFGLGTWNIKKRRWTLGGFDSTKLDPGDTVIVPQKIETYPWMRFLKDTSGILYQLAVTVGVLKSTLNIF